MKSKLVILSMVMMLSVSGYVFGEPLEETEATSGAVEVGNKICPVSGEKVGVMGPAEKYEHNGKIYNFCCKMCIKDFQKDPEKYIQKIEEMMAEEQAQEEVEEGHEHSPEHHQ